MTIRALLIAEAANPEWISVPLVGWSMSEALRRVADCHVVTQVRNRDAFLRKGWVEGKDFTALDSEAIARPVNQIISIARKWFGFGFTLDQALGVMPYLYFERLVWQRFGAELRQQKWDVVHRITPLSPTIPSALGRRLAPLGIPFVVGPLNGGVPWPDGFGAVRRKEGDWLSVVRDLHRLAPYYRSTRTQSSALLAGSQATLNALPAYCRDRAIYLPENAVDRARFTEQAATALPTALPVRVAFLGRLVPYKGADMLIEAAAPLIRDGKVVLDIIGDGPERASLEALCEREGVSAGVTFAGWLAHERVADRLRQSQVFGFPSIREFGGGVVLEAMALGLVPLVADYAGPSELVTMDCGIRVPFHDRRSLVAGVRTALLERVADPHGTERMARNARDRIQELFTWDKKALQILQIYEWALGRATKPSFPFLDGRSSAEGPSASTPRLDSEP